MNKKMIIAILLVLLVLVLGCTQTTESKNNTTNENQINNQNNTNTQTNTNQTSNQTNSISQEFDNLIIKGATASYSIEYYIENYNSDGTVKNKQYFSESRNENKLKIINYSSKSDMSKGDPEKIYFVIDDNTTQCDLEFDGSYKCKEANYLNIKPKLINGSISFYDFKKLNQKVSSIGEKQILDQSVSCYKVEYSSLTENVCLNGDGVVLSFNTNREFYESKLIVTSIRETNLQDFELPN